MKNENTAVKKRGVGDSAPRFSLPDQDGKTHALKDVIGKKCVVLIFYPGDMTPGCTIQLCGIRDQYQKIKEKGAVVFAINHADQESHKTFAKKYRFPFPLLTDTNKNISKKYGAIRKLFTQTLIKRTVVVIDKSGRIRYQKHGMPKESEILKAITVCENE